MAVVRVVMRFKVTPFVHPEHSRLQKRSESLARLWEVGHVVFVLFLALAFATPVAVGLVPLVDRDLPWERAWSVASASAAACGLIAAIGFAIKRYATRRGTTP